MSGPGGPVPLPGELEVLSNLMLGRLARAPALPPATGIGVRAALDSVLLPALQRTPCVVSFSGGRDSSAVLALAVDCARRHGLTLPVPVIMRFAGAPASEETEWQRLVLDHLGLGNGHPLALRDELDAIGPAAQAVLRRHGVVWPGNAYMHRPVLELARGGSLLTGIGGDELFTTTSPRRSARQLALASLPAAWREEVLVRRRPADRHGWLTPDGNRRVHRALLGDEVSYPYRWDRALHHWYRTRVFAALDGALRLVAEGLDVRVVNPLIAAPVLAELAPAGGRRGFPSRTEAMRSLVGDLLPAASLGRSTKASFGAAVWGPAVRGFGREWDGHGVDARYVDPDGLRAELRRAEPDFRSILVVQQAWLQSLAGSPETS